MPTFPRQPALSRWTQQESLASQERQEMRDLDLQRAWVSQMTFSGHFARMKQNETERIRWKNAPYSRGTDRCFLCMRFQGSTRFISGHRFSLVSSSRSEAKNKGKIMWNMAMQMQNYSSSALCWEVVTPWGLALRNSSSQSTREPCQCKVHAGRE